jgi:AAA domain
MSADEVKRNISEQYLLVDPDSIKVVEAGDYLVEGLIPQSEITFVCGPPKHLKSFLVPSWALSIATGRDWFSHKVKQSRVVYNISEGGDAFIGRIKAWQIHNKAPNLNGNFKVLRKMINLYDPVKFVTAVNKIKTQYKPELLVIDTFGRAMGGANETTEDFNKLFANIDALYQEHWPDLTLIIVHHTRKGDLTYRGPQVLAGDCDNIIYIERLNNQLKANVTCEFSRNSAEFSPFSFTLTTKQVPTKKGPKPFPVVNALSKVETTVSKNSESNKARRERELDALAHKILASRYQGPESWTESVSWFELTKTQRGELGLGTTTFSNCMKRLLAKQKIRMWKTAKNTFYQAVLEQHAQSPRQPANLKSSSKSKPITPEAPITPSITPSTPSTPGPFTKGPGVQELGAVPESAPRSSGVISSESSNGNSTVVRDKAQIALEHLLNKRPA